MEMKNPFAKKLTVKEQVRASNRDIAHGVRDIEREVLLLKREEQKLLKDIKAAAKSGNTAGARLLAKSLVRLRGQMTKLVASTAQLRGVRSSVTSAAATSTVGQSMATATKAMQAVGGATDPIKMQRTMAEFARENEKLGMAGEVMDDALEDAFDTDEVEEDTEDVVAQVLDEIGIDLSAQLKSAPNQKIAQRQPAQVTTEAEDDLTSRLAALR